MIIVAYEVRRRKLRSTRNFVAEIFGICVSNLKIEGSKICDDGMKSKWSYKMIQHLTNSFKLPLMNFMRFMQEVDNEGNVDGQVRGIPNIEQPMVVQKKNSLKRKLVTTCASETDVEAYA